MVTELYALLSLAFGLGLLHALDADHIAAVSVLSSKNTTRHAGLLYALQWGLGHGLVLVIMSLVFYRLGEYWPVLVSELAERLVGLVLIALGLIIFYQLQQRRLSIHFHTHKGLLPHAHWQTVSNTSSSKPQHQHKATMIGGLHGLAGSAPLLVSLPLVQRGSLTELFVYIVVFSVGVFVAMISFGGLLGWLLNSMAFRGHHYLKILQATLAVFAVVTGVRLVGS